MTKIQIRRDSSSNWKTNNPILAAGELALETDTMLMKVGDGSSPYLNLSYQNGSNECFNKDTDGNFNNYTKEGCYFISANATIQNGPTSSSGVALNGGFYLMVYNRSNLASSVADPVVLHLQLAFAQGMAWLPVQDFTQLNGQLFIRTFHSSGGGFWTPWLEVTTNFILKDLLVAGDNIQLDVDKNTGKVTLSSTVPTNMVTTDTTQTITGSKTFNNLLVDATGTGQRNVLRANISTSSSGTAIKNILTCNTDLDSYANTLSIGSSFDTIKIGKTNTTITDGNNNKFLTLVNIPTGTLKYWTGTEAAYTELGTKDPDTLYRTTDTNKVFLGTIQLGG